jgi:hypothetical protein
VQQNVKQQLNPASYLFIYVLQSYRNEKTEIPATPWKADFKKKTDAERKNENPGPVKPKTGQFQLTEREQELKNRK